MFGKMLSKSLQSFCQHGFNIGQHFLAQQHKRLFGAAGRNAGAMNVFAGEEPLLDRACCGEGVAEEMRAGQIEPVLQRFAVKAGANRGVEKRLACAKLLKLMCAKQQHVLVQAGENDLAFGKQLRERL